MRILHVVPTYIPAWRYGGPIHSVHGLCKGLASRGHDVHVATTNVNGRGDSDVPLDRPVMLDGVTVHYFASRHLRQIYYSPPLRAFFASTMHTWDVVHTHSVFLWPTTVAAATARSKGTNYVLSPRGMLVRDLILRRRPWVKRLWIEAFERRNIAHAKAVHITSAIEGQELVALGLKPRRLIEIPNGIDVADTNDMQGVSPVVPAKYALFLGRISWKKGLDRLLHALVMAPMVQAVIAGNDDEDYWPTIAALSTKLGVANRIYRLGYIEGAAKRLLLARARMLVLPSYSENFGNVVLEAMAAGVPVVVSQEVGLANKVSATNSGRVVSGDHRDLATAVNELWHDEAVHATLAANALRASNAYSWPAIAARFEEAYLGL